MIIGEKLKSLLKERGLTARSFGEMVGVSEGMVYKYYHLNKIDTDTAQKWAALLSTDPSFFLLADYDPITIHNSIVNDAGAELVPLLPLSARGGRFDDFLLSVKESDCERVVSPIRGADFIITVAGDSMAPEYPNGSQLVIKKIDQSVFIEWGRVYVLDTKNGTVIKRVLKASDPLKIVCCSISSDPAFAPFEVAIADIYGFYSVLMLMAIK